jgi:hypothetical protein
MGNLRRRLPWLAVTAAILVASGAFASNVFGTDPHEFDKGSLNASPGAKMSSHSKTGIKFTQISSRGTVDPGRFESATGVCPRVRPHPISGFFDSNSASVALTTSRPVSPGRRNRQWIVGVSNFGGEPAEYLVGVICAK